MGLQDSLPLKIAAFFFALISVLGASLYLAGAIRPRNIHPNELLFLIDNPRGASITFGYFATVWTGYTNHYSDFNSMRSCDGLRSATYRNSSHQIKSPCITVNELSEEGDESGFIYPGNPEGFSCGEAIGSRGGEICVSDPAQTSCSETYVTSRRAADAQTQSCKNNQSLAGLEYAAGTLLLLSGLGWLGWIVATTRDSSVKSQLGIMVLVLTGVAILVAVIAFASGSNPSIPFMTDSISCSSMSNAEFYDPSNFPNKNCYVVDEECDVEDVEAASSFEGTCEFISDEGDGADCQALTDDIESIDTSDVGDCSQAICADDSQDDYDKPCCRRRRACCGDDADCTGEVPCAWFDNSGDDSDLHFTCVNRFKEEYAPCNEVQQKVFDDKLLNTGKCFARSAVSESYIGGDSEVCRPNPLNRLVVAAKVFVEDDGNNVDDGAKEDLVDPNYIKDNIPECIVRQIFDDCRTDCAEETIEGDCQAATPIPNSEDNCVWNGDINICIPPDNSGTEGFQDDHPMEFCESLMTGADDATNKANCLGSEKCAWLDDITSVGGIQGGCVARACSGSRQGSNFGYQPSQSKRCTPMDGPTNSDHTHTPEDFKECNDPSKGCTPAEESALCQLLMAVEPGIADSAYSTSNRLVTYFDGNDPTAFGDANQPFWSTLECPLTTDEDRCLEAATGNCALVYDAEDEEVKCVSKWEKCSGNMKDAIGKEMDIARWARALDDAENSGGGEACLDDKDGNSRVPLYNEMRTMYRLWVAGFSLGLIGLIAMTAIFIREETSQDGSSGKTRDSDRKDVTPGNA